MSVMEVLSASDTPLSLAYLSERLSLNKSTLYGILNTLTTLGYVENNHHLYRLGNGVLGFHDHINNRHEKIKNKYHFHLIHVSKTTNKLALLSLPCGENNYICIQGYSKESSLDANKHIGKKAAYTSTPTGKLILAFFQENNLNNMIKLDEELRDEIKQIRHQGYATNLNEQDAEILHIAVPLYSKGKAIAAVSLLGTKEQLNPKSIREYLEVLQGTSAVYTS